MKIWRKVFTIIYCLFLSQYINCQNAAPSSYLSSYEMTKADIITRKAKVTISTPASYFSSINFNNGSEMSGYSGIQEREETYTRNFFIFPWSETVIEHLNIFSIWNSNLTNEKITASYVGEGTIVRPFGGEGEGTQTLNVDFGWTLGYWQTIVLRRWDIPGKTRIGHFVHNGYKNEWRHMVTLDYPVAGQHFRGGISAFLEDWLGTGQNKRRYEISESYKRNSDTKQWIPLNENEFSSNSNDRFQGRSRNYAYSFDAGSIGNSFFMQIGGDSKPQSCQFRNDKCLLRVYSAQSPNEPTIDYTVTFISTREVKWTVPKNQTPQFAYTIRKGNNILIREINPQARSFTFSQPLMMTDTIGFEVEDIYGNVKGVSIPLQGNAPY